jgi:hypothetical protein
MITRKEIEVLIDYNATEVKEVNHRVVELKEAGYDLYAVFPEVNGKFDRRVVLRKLVSIVQEGDAPRKEWV